MLTGQLVGYGMERDEAALWRMIRAVIEGRPQDQVAFVPYARRPSRNKRSDQRGAASGRDHIGRAREQDGRGYGAPPEFV